METLTSITAPSCFGGDTFHSTNDRYACSIFTPTHAKELPSRLPRPRPRPIISADLMAARRVQPLYLLEDGDPENDGVHHPVWIQTSYLISQEKSATAAQQSLLVLALGEQNATASSSASVAA